MEYGLKVPFRFYDVKDKQNRYFDYVHGNLRTWRLVTDIYHVPTFQIQVDSAITASSDVIVYLVNAGDDSEENITTKFTWDTDLYIETFTSYNYLIYNRSQNLVSNLDEGTYYLKVSVTNPDAPPTYVSYYSEVFNVRSITGYTVITYYSDMDIDGIDYTNGAKAQFENKIIMDNKLFKPEYINEEEGTEDGEGNFLATFKRRVKNYKLVFYAPEYIADAVSLISMHEHITLTTEVNESFEETLTVIEDSFAVTGLEWNDGKAFAKITVEFRTGQVIKTNFADNIT